jgi:hypothetical protein
LLSDPGMKKYKAAVAKTAVNKAVDLGKRRLPE